MPGEPMEAAQGSAEYVFQGIMYYFRREKVCPRYQFTLKDPVDPALLQQALDEAGVSLTEIDLIGVTYGPGLIGALLVGVGPEDFDGEDPLAGIKLQREMEQAAYRTAVAAGGAVPAGAAGAPAGAGQRAGIFVKKPQKISPQRLDRGRILA